MNDKQAIAFTTTLTEREWDTDVSGWRCPVLKIPGAKVEDVFVLGGRVDSSSYEVNHELGVVRWVRPETPERATVFIRLTEELSTKELTVWWKKFAIIVPIITALLVGALPYILSKRTPPGDNRDAPNPSLTCGKKVKISVPVDGQHVPVFEEVKGIHQDLPPGHKIWTLVYPPNIGKYYPQNEAELIDNTWASKVVVGLDHEAGRTFHIYAVLADEKAHKDLSLYAQRARDKNESPGVTDLPEGVRICQFIRVTRN
jgi:hypothetical protein